MTVKALNELDLAISYLRQAGAARDSLCGQWSLPDNTTVLGANPISAARELRRTLIQQSIDNARRSGRYMTR